MLYPFLQPLYVGRILFIEWNSSEMHVAGDDFVKGEYDSLDIVPALCIPTAAYLGTVVEVEYHEGVGIGVDEKIPRRDILVGDAVLEIQVVDDASQLAEPLELKYTRLILTYGAARNVETCKADDAAVYLVQHKSVKRDNVCMRGEAHPQVHLVPQLVEELNEEVVLEDGSCRPSCVGARHVGNKVDIGRESIQLEEMRTEHGFDMVGSLNRLERRVVHTHGFVVFGVGRDGDQFTVR